MNVHIFNPLRWRKSFLITVLIAFVTVWFLFIDSHSLLTRVQLNSQKADLKERTEQLRHETAILEKNIEELSGNPALLERIAREEYGMRKPGETVYRVQD